AAGAGGVAGGFLAGHPSSPLPGRFGGCRTSPYAAGITMSFFVLSPMAKSSTCSARGTPNFASARPESSRDACPPWSRLARVALRAPGCLAHLLGHEVLEPGP